MAANDPTAEPREEAHLRLPSSETATRGTYARDAVYAARTEIDAMREGCPALGELGVAMLRVVNKLAVALDCTLRDLEKDRAQRADEDEDAEEERLVAAAAANFGNAVSSLLEDFDCAPADGQCLETRVAWLRDRLKLANIAAQLTRERDHLLSDGLALASYPEGSMRWKMAAKRVRYYHERASTAPAEGTAVAELHDSEQVSQHASSLQGAHSSSDVDVTDSSEPTAEPRRSSPESRSEPNDAAGVDPLIAALHSVLDSGDVHGIFTSFRAHVAGLRRMADWLERGRRGERVRSFSVDVTELAQRLEQLGCRAIAEAGRG